MKDKKEVKKQVNPYFRYSGMAMELLVLLFILVFLGKKADAYFANKKDYITALFVLLGMTGYLYRLYLQVIKSDKK